MSGGPAARALTAGSIPGANACICSLAQALCVQVWPLGHNAHPLATLVAMPYPTPIQFFIS